MKLKSLKGIANNVLRFSDWRNPLLVGIVPGTITVDLLTGAITPARDGEDIEVFYAEVVKWFKDALSKESIPISMIEKAVITIPSDGEQSCVIIADGRTFESIFNVRHI